MAFSQSSGISAGLLAVIGQHALEDLLEHLVEAVEQAFVLHEGGAREVIERLGRLLDHVLVERFEQSQVLLQARPECRRREVRRRS
jgi:hypothetical protein